MHILIVIHSLDAGGAERVTAHLSRLWIAAGRQVTIATLSAGGSFYALDPSVRVAALGLARESRGTVEAVIGNVRRVCAIRALIRDLKPDVTIGMMTTASVHVAIASLGLPSRTLGVEHCYPPYFATDRRWTLLRKYAYGLLDVVIAQTEMASAWLSAHTYGRHFVTIPNAVEWPLPVRGPTISPAAIVATSLKLILAAGRLEPEKGFNHLIEAFAKLQCIGEGWCLVILGEGSERAALENRVRALGLEQCIFLPGQAGNMKDWYDRASLFVLSSMSEGFPMALLESMAAGVPAVSFDCDAGPREMVRHGVNGALVPVGDEAALAKAMGALMSDERLRAEMAGRAIAVRERFSKERVLALWDEAFKAACGTRSVAEKKEIWRSK
jgi:glycosyltransferase involved in cell wall biosynthesis